MQLSSPDVFYPDINLTRIAFGSCHSRGAVNKRIQSKASSATNDDASAPISTVWDVISSTLQPQTFLWTGDAIYPPMSVKGDTPLHVMLYEYDQMLQNNTLGYARFLQNDLIGGVHGTWDDHDYGGNDRGSELKDREARRDAYLNFLGVLKENKRYQRQGVYSSVEFGDDVHSMQYDSTNTQGRSNNKVKVIFLDTRWHREKHCIPSVGSNLYIPFGAIISCVTRWLTAGLNLPSWRVCPTDSQVLGDEQWIWLEKQLKDSTASMHIVVSSIQILTTNPVVESWGHFPKERERFLRLLNDVNGLVLLSGDVHHAEISVSSHEQRDGGVFVNDGSLVEVTSSGLTHSCDGPKLYGPLCRPILNKFPGHRFKGGNVADTNAQSYFESRNFGSIGIDWSSRSFEVKIHNESGDAVLATGLLGMDASLRMSDGELDEIRGSIDGHFLPLIKGVVPYCIVVLLITFIFYFARKRSNEAKSHDKQE